MPLEKNIPLPHDIPLALPAPEWLLVTLLVLSFLVHLIFVNLMVGGSLLTLFFEWAGLKRRDFDQLAHEIARTVTVNKSLAVVMGVAPLLLINTLYTIYFYTANALTGLAWILIVPLVAVAFLLTYLHKYSWERLAEHKLLHLSIAAASSLIFLIIPLVFLANINIMLFPDRWHDVQGFLSALMLPNVWPRYLHFLAACFAATALFLVFYFKRSSYPWDSIFVELSRTEALRIFYTIALISTASQFIIGPLVFITIPSQGVTWTMNIVLLLGIVAAIPALYWMWREIADDPARRGRYAFRVSFMLGLTVLFMVSARHIYRASALGPHQEKMADKTLDYSQAVAEAQRNEERMRLKAGTGDQGRTVFKTYCIACHSYNQRLVGPPVIEIQKVYEGNPQGIANWAKAPGKKRPDFPPMPAIAASEGELLAAAEYMLKMKSD
jgi:cytochrome c